MRGIPVKNILTYLPRKQLSNVGGCRWRSFVPRVNPRVHYDKYIKYIAESRDRGVPSRESSARRRSIGLQQVTSPASPSRERSPRRKESSPVSLTCARVAPRSVCVYRRSDLFLYFSSFFPCCSSFFSSLVRRRSARGERIGKEKNERKRDREEEGIWERKRHRTSIGGYTEKL